MAASADVKSDAYCSLEEDLRKNVLFPSALNVPGLLRYALSLRRNPEALNLPQLSHWQLGSGNMALTIRFNDGTEWIAKVPCDGDFDPVIVESEASTMKLVRERTTIPVPEVYGYACTPRASPAG